MIKNGKLVIPKPQRAIHYDANGNAFDVFRFKLMDGSYLDIDVMIALQQKNTKAFLDAEYVRAELSLGGWY